MTKRKDISYRSNKCLNCNTPLDVSEKYCHYCGQLNSTKKITVSDFFEEFFSNFYAYDSKLRNTFLFLFSKPGFVAKQIIEGKRQTFANPFRLFLSISIIYFLITGFYDNISQGIIKFETNKKNDSIQNNYSYYSSKEIKKSNYFSKKLKIFENYYSQLETNNKTNFQNANKKLGLENNQSNLYIFNRAELLNEFSHNLWNSKLAKAYNEKRAFIMFLILPFIALGFLLIFRKKDLNYTDHLVFVYTTASVLFIKYFFDFLILITFNLNISILTFLVFLFYIYKSLRKFYQTSRWKTIFKFVTLNIVSLLISLPVIIISILVVLLTTSW